MATREHYWKTVPGKWPESPSSEQLTEAGVNYLLQHQKTPPREAVRADSAGLRMIEKMDDSNRPVRTFELPAGTSKRDTWLSPYLAEPQLMIRLNKNANPPGSAEALAYESRWRETQAMIASGQYTLPEL